MITYAISFLWIFILAGGFAGWGMLFGRGLLGRDGGDLGEWMAWGVAGTIALGGLANLFHWISATLLLGYTAVGVVYFLAEIWRRPHLRDRSVDGPSRDGRKTWIRLWFGAVVCLILVRLAAAAHSTFHHSWDDHYAYLAFPHQMLQTGGLTPDPYSNRRLVSTLGGMPLLNAFALAAFKEESVGLIDQGVGLIGVLLGAAGLMRSRGISSTAWLVPASLLLVDRAPFFNLSGILTPVMLLLAIHRALGRSDEVRWIGRAALLGLLTAALCAIKSTLIPIAFFLFAVDFLDRCKRREAWRALPIEVATGLACLIPWMIALKQSSGTYLYPLLGRGVEGARGGTYLPPNYDFTPAFLLRNYWLGFTDPVTLATILFLATALASMMGRKIKPDGRRSEDVAILLSPLFSLGLMLWMFDKLMAIRYLHSIFLATMIVAIAVLLRRGVGLRRRHRQAILTFGCIAFFAGARIKDSRISYQVAGGQILAGLKGRPYVDPEVRASYARMQQSVPEGEPILTHLADSYLLDFRRNRIYMTDWPGGASPGSKMPLFRGPEPLAEYLIEQGIRFVAFSYADSARRKEPKPQAEESTESTTWERITFIHLDDFRSSLEALRRSRGHAYQDGELVVIDLSTRAPR